MNDRRLILNLQSETASVEVVDGSIQPILASGPLVSHPHIHANYVPNFSNNLIGISPIIDRGAVGIIQSNKMTLEKIVEQISQFCSEIFQRQ